MISVLVCFPVCFPLHICFFESMVLVAKTKYFQQQDHITFFFLIIQKSLKHPFHHSKNVTQKPSFFELSVFSYPDIHKGYFLFIFYFLSPECSTAVYLWKVSSLVLRSKLTISLAKIITISFPFFLFLHVLSFLTVHSLLVPALFPLQAAVFCLLEIICQIVNEGIHELLSFWVNRPLIVVVNRQIHISLLPQLSL